MAFYYYDNNIPTFLFDNSIIKFFFILLPYEFNMFTYYKIFINTIYFLSFSFFLFYYYLFFVYFYSVGSIQYYNIIYNNVNKKMLFFNRLLINSLLKIFFIESYKTSYKLMDKQIFEIVGPFGIIFNIRYLLKTINKLSTGLIYHYSGIIILSVILFVLLVINGLSLFYFI